jgi:general secretion pathway protein G
MKNFFRTLKNTSKDQAGFSLIEIMAAITIFGIVVGLVAYNVTGSLEQAKKNTAEIAIHNLIGILDEYRRDCHRYPTTEQGLSVLTEKPADCKNWKPGGYIAQGSKLRDPWDNEFGYFSPPVYSQGAKFEIISYGADLVEGGEGEDADINSNKLN